MVQYFTLLGYKTYGCVGGEAKSFIQKISSATTPDIIVATSVLGHGVNLPEIGRVFFLYPVQELDIYLQMIGRGGRNGKGFELHTMNLNYFPKKQILFGVAYSFIKRIRNRVKSFLY